MTAFKSEYHGFVIPKEMRPRIRRVAGMWLCGHLHNLNGRWHLFESFPNCYAGISIAQAFDNWVTATDMGRRR